MHYLIPRLLKLEIYNENTAKTEIIYFDEPNLWQLEYFWRYIQKGENSKAFESIGFEYYGEINEGVLISLVKLIYGDNKKGQGEAGFYPGSIDFFCKRYGVTHKQFMQETTFSNLITLGEGVDYNSNIEAGKPGKNTKYTREEINEAKLDEYNKIADEVEEMERKMKK